MTWDLVLSYFHQASPYLLGYVFSTLVAHWLIGPLMRAFWSSVGDEFPTVAEARARHEYGPKMVGILERALYVASIQFGKPEFVAIWLALKVSGQWKSWSQGDSGRLILNLFLIGNAFSIFYAFAGAKLIEWAAKGEIAQAIAVPLTLIAINVWFWIWAVRDRPAKLSALAKAATKS